MRTRKHIGAIGAYEGNSQLTLADLFDVAVDGSGNAAETKIIIDGDVPRVKRIGEAMTVGEMKSGTIFVKGKVLEMLPTYKDEGTEEVDGVMYRKYVGDLSRNGEGVLYVSV